MNITPIPMAFNSDQNVQVLFIPELNKTFTGESFIEIHPLQIRWWMHEILPTNKTRFQLNNLRDLGYIFP